MRLDQALVDRGLTETRSKARDLILRGEIRVDGIIATKPGKPVDTESEVTCTNSTETYVSRGGLKLAAALTAYNYSAKKVVAIDVGASTGGFTDVLLRNDATHVYAVDVGRDQFHPTLRQDARVSVLESTDARTLDTSLIPRSVTAVVCDASFISLTKVLPAALSLSQPGAWLVALIKPQFELEPAAVGKGGIVKSDADRQRAIDHVTAWIEVLDGWKLNGVTRSPITGKGGNVEYLLGATRHD